MPKKKTHYSSNGSIEPEMDNGDMLNNKSKFENRDHDAIEIRFIRHKSGKAAAEKKRIVNDIAVTSD